MKTTLIKTETFFGGLLQSLIKSVPIFPSGRSKLALFLLLMANFFLSNNSFAQIALRNTQFSTTGSATLTITKPVNLAVGDVMLANLMQSGVDGSSLNEATGSGWTLIAGSNLNTTGNNRFRATLLYKIATATDVAATNFQFTFDSDSDDGQGAISAFSGVDIVGGVGGTPFDVAPGNVYTNINSDAVINASAITTATANTAIIMFGVITDNTNAGSYTTTNPGALTELYDEDFNAGLDTNINASWATKTAIGSTGGGSANLGASANNGGILIALKRFTGTITTGSVPTALCAGSAVTVPYTITGTYASGNVFTAQLSNASGSFASPTAIGSATTTAAGNISATISGAQGAGSLYRIRVVSSLPGATGSDNGSAIVINPNPTAVSGAAVSTCSTSGAVNITAGSSAPNNASVVWSTPNGTGTFTNDNSLTLATYTPSTADITAGSVTITLTANPISPCASSATSSKTLTILSPPTASAGGSATICQNQTHVVSGASSSNGTISWSENGAGNISAGGTTLTPTYTAAAGDAGNTVTLTMTVSNASCSPAATATYTISVIGSATAVAGGTLSTCTNAGATNITAGSSATNNSGITWTSDGTGTIANANSMTLATYAPGLGEVGNITLTLTAAGNSPCGNATSTKTLTILAVPVPTDAVICQGQSGAMTATGCADTASVSSGPNNPGSAANSGTGTAWSNPNNVFSDNNSNATFTGSTSSATLSQALHATNYGFALPADAIIEGVAATVGKYRSGGLIGGEAQDSSVRLLKAGTATGNNKALGGNWSTSETASNYGNATDLWGTTWTAAEINAANFGVAFVGNITQSTFGNRTANIDYIRVTVTYRLPGVLEWYTASSGGSPIGTGASFNPVGVAGSGLVDTNTPGTTTYYVGCSTVALCRTPVNFVINALPTVSFTGLDASYCEDAASVTLTGNEATGTFTGNGITDNGDGTATFSPVTAGVGSHPITFSYTNGNSCTNTSVQNVAVVANVTYYADADGDTFGNPAVTQLSCTGAPVGFVANNTDCDDTDNTKNTTFQFYADADGDTYGAGSLVPVCAVDALTPPAGYSLDGTDCDDADNAIHESFEFYTDGDGDSFGAGSLVPVCAVDALTPPAGYSLNATDCNDGDNSVWQTATLYVDADSDNYSSGDTEEVCYGAAIPVGYLAAPTLIDCNDNIAAVNPGHVEVLYNGIDDNCDGSLDEGNQITTSLLASMCNTTLTSINSLIGIKTIAPGSAYTGWRIRLTSGAQVQVIEKTVPHFLLTEFPVYEYATTYTVDIQLQRNGIWLGYYGPTCQVSSPAILDEGGAASVSASQCGIVLPKINTLIATTSLPGVTGYRFQITNLTDPLGPNAVQTIERTQNWFSLQMLARYNYGTTYRIEIGVKTGTGSFGGYGAPCEISSPSAPSLVNCGGVVATTGTNIAATSVNGATQYRFQIVRSTDNASSTIDRNINYFTFNQVPAVIYSPGTVYNVRVAVLTVGTWSPFGDVCEITSPGIAARPGVVTAPVATTTEFKASAFPNPFATDFAIDVTTSSADNVQVKVYDMLGRLVESKEVKVSEINAQKVGEQYPAGVYNVIVSQGDIVKTLRVVKR